MLSAVAVEAGLDESAVRAFLDSTDGIDEVRAEIDEAHALGISSVPTFVFAGKHAVSGAQDPQLLLRTLEEVAPSRVDLATRPLVTRWSTAWLDPHGVEPHQPA